MVSGARVYNLTVALLLLSLSSLSAKDYRLGDVAQDDISTPVPLEVVDTNATDALKQKEALRIPVVYRFDSQASAAVEFSFQSAFSSTRSNFLASVESNFHKPTLTPSELSSDEFGKFVNGFQKENTAFPVGQPIAGIWAGGESGDAIETPLQAALRETMRQRIRGDFSPPDVRVGSTLQLVTVASNETVTAQILEDRGSVIPKTEFVSLPRAKSELLNHLSSEPGDVAKFVVSLVRPNCLMEADLTRELRAEHSEGIVAADHYEAGEILVRRGQIIDAKILAALNLLKEKTAADRVQQFAALEREQDGQIKNEMRLIIAISSLVLLILLVLVWKMTRRTHNSLLPVLAAGDLDALEMESADSDNWRRRALMAEHDAQQARAANRAGLISQLAQWMSDKFVQSLMSQRADLLEAHRRAAEEMAELEARLERIHAPLQERLRAYEKRISELERDLLIKGEENRELIKAKIQITQKQLEIERQKRRVEFN